MGEQSDTKGRRDALRTAVLNAAEARVASSGLTDLGVREIAREASCSSGMVYKLFTSHDELVLCVNARTLAVLADAMTQCLREIVDPADAICAMADAYLDFASANTPRWDALFAHRMTAGAALPPWYEDQRNGLFDKLAMMIDAAATPISDGDFARTLFSAVHGVVALGLQQKVGSVSLDKLRTELRALVEVITRGLGAAPPPVSSVGDFRPNTAKIQAAPAKVE